MVPTREDWRREAWAWLALLKSWNQLRRLGSANAGWHSVEAARAALRCRARARAT